MADEKAARVYAVTDRKTDSEGNETHSSFGVRRKNYTLEPVKMNYERMMILPHTAVTITWWLKWKGWFVDQVGVL